MTDKVRRKPTFKKMGLTLGDSLDIVPRLADHSVSLTVTSPPYYVGKPYDVSTDLSEFRKLHEKILPEVIRATRNGGSICWQVGYHLKDGVCMPLDFIVHSIMADYENIYLRNRIAWTFGHGLHSMHRFSGRHEVILWYTIGKEYFFDLDAVRVPQKYPGKRHYKGARYGEPSGNPLGKNPSDVWDFPNVKAAHAEKTAHPCQFPIALVRRLVRALCPPDGLVLDPFIGSGTTAVAAVLENRKFIGIEKRKQYFKIACSRVKYAKRGQLAVRGDQPVIIPDPNWKVSKPPSNFTANGSTGPEV
ncbi:MAG TPA: site-specific DNA-methyltransferase [Stellaceae bacterium]|nr:site-specific DNA-methyltransferase [Stellaceae bacterium]